MPITHHDPDDDQLVWDNHDRTQTLVIGPPDPEEAGWETARDNHWACWLEVSGYAFGLDADHTRRLGQLALCADDGVERTAAIPAAAPHTDLTLHVDTGLGRVVLRVARDDTDTGSRADIPAHDCPTIAAMLDTLSR
ncbi:hypothetical protein [Nonomuraea basaltis]|uniref:hypothetical protein n=1 Tax=Nonomuraea basaltis TaxID=2495887 RepID=UPI00110C6FE6|nr:hypothetical protein [Nonomuraea basaltis]TMR90548.1 hypothetical protein EJK15_54885 [Nonomuraea basaltis]